MSNSLYEEMRQDMLVEAYQEEREERLLRTDDEVFGELLQDEFYDRLSAIKSELYSICYNYDRSEASDEWFQELLDNI